MSNKYEAPQGPPPGYPQQPPQAHYDAGPAGGDPRGYGGYGSPPPQQQYGSPQPYGPGPYGPPQQGYYQQPQGQQPMYYQQQPYPPQGGYYDNRGRSGAGEGICAGILGALACCCCLDFCIF